jgi:hypothetical protein
LTKEQNEYIIIIQEGKMYEIKIIANDLCNYLNTIEEIKSCKIYGSIAEDNFDKYSDIDIEIDVSGYDNSIFLTRIPEIINEKYPIIYYDYARSLMPNQYIVSMAISKNNPFLIVDTKCIANPHMITLRKENNFINSKTTHILKLFIANYKHYIRGDNCDGDIIRMYKNIYTKEESTKDMLIITYNWLYENISEKYKEYIMNVDIKII